MLLYLFYHFTTEHMFGNMILRGGNSGKNYFSR